VVRAELKPRHVNRGSRTRSNAGPIRVRAESPSVTRKRAFLNHASNAANQCHFVPCPENEHYVVEGDCTNPFRDWGLNHFWAWRSAVKTFSNAAWFKLSPPKVTLQTVNGRIHLRAGVQSVTRD
jgi:hypothetical protein